MEVMLRREVGIACVLFCLGATGSLQSSREFHAPFDTLLDQYVRDGYVYYLALQKERGALDRYVASLDVPRARIESWSKADQEAFWVNAYNAFVLETVIDAYPIKGKSPDYPPKSIRQIPGAFDQKMHKVGGQSLTLDDIEKTVIVPFGDARLLLALGRGALGSGRLRSEAYHGESLDEQLGAVVKECATRVTCVRIDQIQDTVEVTPLVSWREEAFVRSYAAASGMWSNRSPIERAVAAMIYPFVFQSERVFLSANTFQMKFGSFDWRLNDLTGGVPE
jgi:hypothetical protein